MDFQRLEETGTLEIEYIGDPLDLYAFGLFHLNIQYIVDKVAFGLLSEQGLLEPSWKRGRNPPQRFPPVYPRFIRAEISEIRLGSLSEAIVFALATVLADPNVIAVLQNLAANVVWAVGASGVRGIQRRISSPPNENIWRQKDPFEIGPNLRDVMLAIAESNGGKISEIKFRYRAPSEETLEVSIVIKEQPHDDMDIVRRPRRSL
jgi:hypothetical protein